MKKFLIILSVLLMPFFLQAKTVTAVGEAQINNDDIASAKLRAVARAKWAALEEAAGIRVKVETIAQDAVLVDEAIKTEVGGVIKDYKITDEGKDNDIYWVKLSAEVLPEKAKKAFSFLSKNTKIAVMLPVVLPNNEVRETNPLSEKVINDLAAQNLEVVDLASAGSELSVKTLKSAMDSGNFMEIRNIANQFLSGVMLIGKVESTATAKSGKDVGYGITLPFNVVTGRLTYRLIGEKNGQKLVLASGYVSGRGHGPTVEDAAYRMMENLSTNVSNRLISVVLEKIKGTNSKRIEVVLAGNNDLDKLLELKNELSYISWVLSVENKSEDTLVVEYPEKSIYLATAIDDLMKYEIKELDKYKIVLRGD
ncbi:MAG: hypothetical protein FXF49_09885 [Flexistipes sinusarabici]|uniref:Flagellar assembly protein T N-terminal domain-containing protein n=1 Tax=Flexistipes sinusarabici TaxID=2352 RepID=A0A5D0MK26_FLESI|nr:hypothetical protein [Flexistipes sinusarabici]TYB32752.1 MAG: hypothetical protein FXF49_09885 [Flexistipes sinusarabici]